MQPEGLPQWLVMALETSVISAAGPTPVCSIRLEHTDSTARYTRAWLPPSSFSSAGLKERNPIQSLGETDAERGQCARHHVDGSARFSFGRAVEQQRHEHVLPVQCPVGRDVRNRLVLCAIIPILPARQGDAPGPRRGAPIYLQATATTAALSPRDSGRGAPWRCRSPSRRHLPVC